MSPLFGRKKNTSEKTVLILDVENGSVGACLARLSPGSAPKVFGETRRAIPLQTTRDTDAIAGAILQASEKVLAHVAEVAARVRSHDSLASAGEVSQVVIFLSPPWGALSIVDRALEPHPFVGRIKKTAEAFFGSVSVRTEPFSLMAAYTAPIMFPSDEHYLVSVISGEVTELVLLENVGSHLKITGHASMPFGRHYPLRTLLSHGQISEAEARSALNLHGRGTAPRGVTEALHTAGREVAREFSSLATELLAHAPAKKVVVVAEEPVGEWFARSFAESPTVAKLFPDAGEVRAVRARHALPFMSVHARRPDLPLLLEVLFTDTQLAR